MCRHSLNDGTMRTTVARSASGQCLACGHGARGLCFRYLWFGEPVGALQETTEGVEELARRRTIIRRFGLFIFQPPCGCHSDMSPKTLPTVQVVDKTHRHWFIDQHRSLPHPTVARQQHALGTTLFWRPCTSYDGQVFTRVSWKRVVSHTLCPAPCSVISKALSVDTTLRHWQTGRFPHGTVQH